MPWVEPKFRMLLIALATVSLMSGCALTSNTTAQWTYRWAGPDGSGPDVRSTNREDVVDGIDCYVARRQPRDLVRRRAGLASVEDTFGGEPASRYSPSRPTCVWPLEIGTAV
jgi:hypothetical protein